MIQINPSTQIQDVEREIRCASRTTVPDLGSVARALRMSPRSLQRLLMDHGKSFSQLVEQVMRERAVQLLVREDLTMSEIARMLGYSDPSNFGRAVRKWTGQSPKQWRTRLLRECRRGMPKRKS